MFLMMSSICNMQIYFLLSLFGFRRFMIMYLLSSRCVSVRYFFIPCQSSLSTSGVSSDLQSSVLGNGNPTLGSLARAARVRCDHVEAIRLFE